MCSAPDIEFAADSDTVQRGWMMESDAGALHRGYRST